MAEALADILRHQQRQWAMASGIPVDGRRWTRSLAANLFQPMSEKTKREFEAGGGLELGQGGDSGKMQALHSSSALVCNVFDYWRGKDLARLGRALGTPETPSDFKFEQKYATGLKGSPANLDVVIFFTGPNVLAIESKYTEPYPHGKRQSPAWSAAYFPAGPGVWEQHRLFACEALARSVNDGAQTFANLDAAQLLKHILALTQRGLAFTLLYLWYDWPAEEAANHRKEIDRFGKAVDQEVDFRSLTYQEFFARLQPELTAEDHAYSSYLAGRYFTLPAQI